MAGLIQLKKRIQSVGNISKITKAMEMVSAAKMRQAQIQALNSRHYSRKLDEILTKIAAVIDTNYHPLLQSQSATKNEAILVISTDRGLTGSLNANLFKAIEQFQTQHQADVYSIGRIAKEYTIKSGHNLVAEFGEVGNHVDYQTTQPISQLLQKEFMAGKYSRIWIAYMDFISTLNQVPRITQLLPVSQEETASAELDEFRDYVFEPDAPTILSWLLPYFIEMKVYQSMLEARASEHSARMVAMKNASDNAQELGTDLTLAYNRSRQDSITNELSDIVTATLSLSH